MKYRVRAGWCNCDNRMPLSGSVLDFYQSGSGVRSKTWALRKVEHVLHETIETGIIHITSEREIGNTSNSRGGNNKL